MAEHAIYVKGHFVFKTIRERSIVALIPFKWIEKHLKKVYHLLHGIFSRVCVGRMDR